MAEVIMTPVGHTIIAKKDGKLVSRFDRTGHLQRDTVPKRMAMPTGRLWDPQPEPDDPAVKPRVHVVEVDNYRLVEANYRAQRFVYQYESTV
jgi:hypothetical protein